jgi:phenylalanyl-tRNA synthetase alpha subunit
MENNETNMNGLKHLYEMNEKKINVLKHFFKINVNSIKREQERMLERAQLHHDEELDEETYAINEEENEHTAKWMEFTNKIIAKMKKDFVEMGGDLAELEAIEAAIMNGDETED